MRQKSLNSDHFKKAAISITLSQLLLGASLSLASDQNSEFQKKPTQKNTQTFELLDAGPHIAGGDTNYVCGNNYGCV